MTEQQYRQMLKNRSRRSVALFSGGAADGLLRTVAREAKRRGTAEEAWQSITPAAWAELATVAWLREGTLVIEAESAALRERIRRQAGTLLRQLKARVPGLTALRVAAPSAADGPREEID